MVCVCVIFWIFLLPEQQRCAFAKNIHILSQTDITGCSRASS